MFPQTSHELNYGDDVDSAEDISDEDDFDFYRLQMLGDLEAAANRTQKQQGHFADRLLTSKMK